MGMCDAGDMGGKGSGITLIIIGGKPPMPPGHSLASPDDQGMTPHIDLGGGDEADLAPPKDAMPPKRPMMNTRSMNTKRDVMKPRGL